MLFLKRLDSAGQGRLGCVARFHCPAGIPGFRQRQQIMDLTDKQGGGVANDVKLSVLAVRHEPVEGPEVTSILDGQAYRRACLNDFVELGSGSKAFGFLNAIAKGVIPAIKRRLPIRLYRGNNGRRHG